MTKPDQPAMAAQEDQFAAAAREINILLRPLKIAWLASWLAINTILVTLPIMLAAILGSSGNFAFNLARVWAWALLKVTGVRLSVTGREKIDRDQTYIIVSNHQSHFDGPAIAVGMGVQLRWIAKRELLKIPVMGYALKAMNNIFVDRSNKEKSISSIREGMERLPAGVSIMVFAEGTRSANGRIGPFKKGGFMVALSESLPILPVTIIGSEKVLPKNSLTFQSHPIELVIGDPIDTAHHSEDSIEELMNQTRDVVISNQRSQSPA